jgi:hypothetical protein
MSERIHNPRCKDGLGLETSNGGQAAARYSTNTAFRNATDDKECNVKKDEHPPSTLTPKDPTTTMMARCGIILSYVNDSGESPT